MKVGDKFVTTKGEQLEVIQYISWDKVQIKFMNGYTCFAESGQIRKGNVKNPYLPNMYGVGFIGEGNHKSRVQGKKTLAYNTWKSMIERCYDYKRINFHPTYDGVTVCKEWHNFQNFAEWFTNQPNYGINGFELDKDMIKFHNKVYCPEYCSLLPRQINQLCLFKDNSVGGCKQGVHWSKSNNKFVAQISIEGEQEYLGGFLTEDEAYDCYLSSKIAYVRKKAEKYKYYIPEVVYENLINYLGK